MSLDNPLKKTKAEFREVMDQISLPESPVGIDAKYTHAIIIDFLQQISARLDAIEARLK